MMPIVTFTDKISKIESLSKLLRYDTIAGIISVVLSGLPVIQHNLRRSIIPDGLRVEIQNLPYQVLSA